MSYGTDRGHKTKKALKEDIARRGPEAVGVFGTSMFGNEAAANVAELRDTDVVVGPNVYSKRSWYASGAELKKVKRVAPQPEPAPFTLGAVLAHKDRTELS